MKGFSEKTLGEILTLQRGFDITKKEQTFGVVPIVSSSGISSYHNQVKVKAPGVVIGRKGTLGTVHYINKDFWPHDTTLWVKDFKNNDPRFISYYLKTLKLENFDTGASNPTLNRNHVHKIKVIFPELPIQKKISAILSSYDDLIENNKRCIAILENMAEEVYREWFVRFRFPEYQSSEFEKGIPKDWTVKNITKVDSFKFIKRNLDSWDGVKNYYATAQVDGINLLAPTDEITYENKPSRAQYMPLMFSVWFARMKNTFKVLVFNEKNKYLLKKSVLSSGFIGFEADETSYPFLYMLVKSQGFHDSKDMFCTGATQESLTDTGLKAIKVLMPTELILKKFSSEVSLLIKQIVQLQITNNELSKVKEVLLARLISGKLSVEDLDIQFPPSMQEENAA